VSGGGADRAGADVAVALAHVTDAEDERGEDEELPGGVAHHVAHHGLREHRLVPRVRLPQQQRPAAAPGEPSRAMHVRVGGAGGTQHT
jgi:hypothetical protein